MTKRIKPRRSAAPKLRARSRPRAQLATVLKSSAGNPRVIDSNPVSGSTLRTLVKKESRTSKAVRGSLATSAIFPRSIRRNVSHMQDIIMAFALPYEVDAVRYADQYQTSSTAVAKPYNFIQADLSAGCNAAVTNPIIPNGLAVAMLFRDPARAMIYWNANNSAATCKYEATFPNGTLSDTVQASQSYDLNPVFWQINAPSAYQPHGPTLYTGNNNNLSYVWVDVGVANSPIDNSKVVITVSPTSVSGSVELIYFDGFNDVEDAANIALSTGVATFTFGTTGTVSATISGYYAFRLLNPSASCTITAELQLNGCPSLCHLPISALVGNESQFNAVRINTAAMLMTNASAVINLQGESIQCQIPAANYWPSLVNNGKLFDTISKFNGACAMSAQNGCYNFLKPTKAIDFDFHSTFISNNNKLVRASFPIQPEHDYTITMISVGVSGGSWPGLSIYLKGTWGIEWRTNSQLFEQHPRSHSTLEFEEAMDILCQTPQFHENPLHFDDLKRFASNAVSAVGSAAQTVLKYAPAAIAIGSTIAKFL